YGDMRLGQGRENAKNYLRDNPAVMEEITRKLLQKKGLVLTADGGYAPDDSAPLQIPAPVMSKAAKKAAAAAAAAND
ncbi:MAG: hypothetical protein JHC56_02775, partial [Gemmataceae bacterium]|nr:hypothetical protein [Gemmataceae bacterium]